MSAAVIHVIRNLDHNSTTRNICIAGMIAVVVSLINLVRGNSQKKIDNGQHHYDVWGVEVVTLHQGTCTVVQTSPIELLVVFELGNMNSNHAIFYLQIVLMVAMPTFDRWSNTRKLRTIAKHIEVTVGKKTVDWSDSDFEQEMEGIYVNTNLSPNRAEEPVYINVHNAKEATKKSSSDRRLRSSSDNQMKSSSAPRMSPTRPLPSRPHPPSRSPTSRPPHSSSNSRVGQSSSRHATTRPQQSSSHHSHQSRRGHSPTRHP